MAMPKRRVPSTQLSVHADLELINRVKAFAVATGRRSANEVMVQAIAEFMSRATGQAS